MSGMTPEEAREFYKREPIRTARFGIGYRCPDERCGEETVIAVPHPDDPHHEPNRCPTCLATVVPA